MYTYTYLRRIGSYSTYVDTYIAHTIGSEAGGDAGFGTPTVQQLWGAGGGKPEISAPVM